jgi:hypothetical protein
VGDIDLTLTLLQSLGFLINLKKSVLTPTQCLVFLGMELNTITGVIRPSQKRCVELMQSIEAWQGDETASLRQFMRLVGVMTSMRDPTSSVEIQANTEGSTEPPQVVQAIRLAQGSTRLQGPDSSRVPNSPTMVGGHTQPQGRFSKAGHTVNDDTDHRCIGHRLGGAI